MLAFVRRNTIGFIALFIALGGTAYAANTVRSQDIVDGQVKTQDLANGAVTKAKALSFRTFTSVNNATSSSCYAGPAQWRDSAPVTITVPAGAWRVTVTSTVEGDPGNATVQSQFCPATKGPSCIWSPPRWATFFAGGVTSSTASAQTSFAGGAGTSFTYTYTTAVRFSGPVLSDSYTETRVEVENENLTPFSGSP